MGEPLAAVCFCWWGEHLSCCTDSSPCYCHRVACDCKDPPHHHHHHHPSSLPLLSSLGIQSAVSAAWSRRRDESHIPHVAPCVCVYVLCVCVRSRHMLSRAHGGASGALDAVRAGWGHSTSSVSTSPWQAGECVLLHFERLGIGVRRGGGSSIRRAAHTHHTVSPPSLGAPCQKWTTCSAPGGRSALLFSSPLRRGKSCSVRVGSSYFHGAVWFEPGCVRAARIAVIASERQCLCRGEEKSVTAALHSVCAASSGENAPLHLKSMSNIVPMNARCVLQRGLPRQTSR